MLAIHPFTMPLHKIQLEGYGLVLRPLQAGHEPGLAKAAADGELWQLPYTSVPAPSQEGAYIAKALAEQEQGKSLVFTIMHDKEIIGTSRYYNIIPNCARLEIGHTWIAQSYQRTFANTVAKYLMMFYAFESLKANMIAWRTDILNERSQRAIERLGAKKDGIIRGDQRRKDGSVRDSVLYSMSAEEWSKEHKEKLKQKILTSTH